MGSMVKTIFKVLAITMLVPPISFVLIEFFNVTLTSAELSRMTRMSAEKSCELFTQETYKTEGGNGAANLRDLYDDEGNFYLTGNLYGSQDAVEIWYNIYDSDEFKTWCENAKNNSTWRVGNTYGGEQYPWESLEALVQSVDGSYGSVLNGGMPDWNASQDEMDRYSLAMQAMTYRENMYSTANLGIPYLDKAITNKIFRWNLTEMLSNCDPSLIQTDEDGEMFVNYKGFACYTQQAQITNYTYKIYDLDDSSTWDAFFKATGYKASELRQSTGDERNRVCVVGIEFSVPVEYVGITPIKRMFNWVWQQEVEGMNDYHRTEAPLQWTDDRESLTGGGINGNPTLPVSGQLTYTLVR